MTWHGIPDHMVFASLRERHSRVTREIDRARFALDHASRVLAALEMVMALYEPQPQLALPQPAPTTRKAHTSIGDTIGRTVLEILRDSSEPLPLERIAIAVLAKHDIEPTHRRMMKDAKARAYGALKRYERDSVVRLVEKLDGRKAWELVP